MEFITAYGPKIVVNTENNEPSMAKQSMKGECDINFIIQRFQKTGVIEHQREHEGNYGEFTQLDYHEAMNVVAEANSMFETVPSNIRKKFDNDPGKFLQFVTDAKNLDEMRDLGLAEQEIEVIEPVAEPAAAAAVTEPTGE